MSSTVTCKPGRQALDDDDERAAVGLTGGQEAQHPINRTGVPSLAPEGSVLADTRLS